MFEVPGSKGPAYVERRQVIEQAQLPTLARQGAQGLDPQGHPISAALNVGRNLLGAAYKGGYGDLVVVLKEGVKQRCTYTPKDTFYSFEAKLTPERVTAMKAGLALLFQSPKGGLSEEALKARTARTTSSWPSCSSA